MSWSIEIRNYGNVPLNVTDHEFVEEWKLCHWDKTRSLEKLLWMARPFLYHWEAILTDPVYENHEAYMTLCNRISDRSPDPPATIRKWLRETRLLTSIQEELELLFCHVVRTLKVLRPITTAKAGFRIFIQNFKGYLQRKISKKYDVLVDAPPLEPKLLEALVYEETHPDYFFANAVYQKPLDRYYLERMLNGCSLSDRQRDKFRNKHNEHEETG